MNASEGAVALALIPENAANGQRREGGNHAVPEKAGAPAVKRWVPRELREGLAGGFGFVLLALFIGLLGNGVGGVIGHFAARDEDGREGGVFSEGCEADPGFADCAAPGGVDEADGDVLTCGDVAGEVPCNG